MRTSTTIAVLLLCAGLVLPAYAARFQPIEGTAVEGELRSIDKNGTVTIRPTAPADSTEPAAAEPQIKLDDMVRMEFSAADPADPTDGIVIYLANDDRVCGTLAASSPNTVSVDSRSLGHLTISLDKVVAIEFRRSDTKVKDIDKLRAQLLKNETKNDITYSANGDQLTGILVGFEGDSLKLQSASGDVSTVKTNVLFGVSLASRPAAQPAPTLQARIRCKDGSVVTAKILEGSDINLKLKLLIDLDAEIQLPELIDLSMKYGRMAYLSDLKPQKEEYVPYFGGDRTWPIQADRNYDHNPIRIAGKIYRKGLGTFSGTTLTYNLAGEFQKFEALVGIDDADVNQAGNVTIRILADGKEIFQKADITRKGGPAKIELPVKDVKTLVLAVDFGGNMHFGDFTDWADARLIR